MKIAHVQLLPLMTGVQRVSFEELIRLDNQSVDRYLIYKESGELTKYAESAGIKSIFIDSLVREISLINDLKAFYRLYRLCRQEKFDVVHTHSSKTGVLGRIAAKLAGVPMVVHTVHGFSFPAAQSKFAKSLYFIMEYVGSKFSDKVICLHQDDKYIAVNQLKTKESNVCVIANGVNTDKFYPAAGNAQNNKKVIGMVGRLWPQKDPITLAKAGVKLFSRRSDFEIRFIGGGELEVSLKEIINEAKAEQHIRLLGWKDDIAEQLREFDVFVLPSLWEGMPLAILEAQSTKLPCVVSNIQGNNHLVKDQFDGLLFEPKDVDGLVKCLEKLLDDPDFADRLATNARNKIESDFDINDRTKKVCQLYADKLGLNVNEIFNPLIKKVIQK
ncbi:glycosyltransferase family 4 protein [Pseudoalteromonas sp. SG41-2]|uniref:glycosyltransferase family 4 protein n=1 Tax=Pseudoalteromonas sp. SG41-2 TaxID=2760978 RepID=UPI00160153DA|nr:glycosyltransferase family 4 protein [Pseudoalteromonas sp. SG41-2]MBB1481807.1 glycosyltransferase family 4 protein [Pseudoalteromonas sp. SG41-2]